MGLAIGIDLGTTNTVVAAVVDGVAVTLPDENGLRLIPSVVSFPTPGEVVVGGAAMERRFDDPYNTIYSVKRLIGRSWNSPEVQENRARFPFTLAEGPRESVTAIAHGTAYSLPEISAFVLRRAKAVAEAALGQPVDKAVITVPANFNELQRASTKVAGKLAGLEILRILNEPTAAALAYGQTLKAAERVLVYDLGGGTFDVTVLELSGRVFEVLSTAGDTQLGGDDFDVALTERLCDAFVMHRMFDPRTNSIAYGRVRIAAEELKRALSNTDDVVARIEGIGAGDVGHQASLDVRVTRAELEEMIDPLVMRTIGVAQQALAAIGKSSRDVRDVLLVGGPTRIPLLHRRLTEAFGKAPIASVNPDEVVALGAAIQAHALARAVDGSSSTSSKVAAALLATRIGAGDDQAPPSAMMRAGMLSSVGSNEDRARTAINVPTESQVRTRAQRTLLIDVTPFSLRVETAGGYSDVVILSNSPVPCDQTRVFYTGRDNQTSVVVRVAQGESARFADNTYLGELVLDGLPAAKRGELQISVTFELDSDGALNVRATDSLTGRETRASMHLAGVSNADTDVAEMLGRQGAIVVSG